MRTNTQLIALCLGTLVAGCGPSKDELQAEIDRLNSELGQAQDDARAEAQSLESKIKELEHNLELERGALAELERERSMTAEELEQLRADHQRRQKELETYKKLFKRLKKLIDAGKIKVVFRKGRMMVELESAVLFDSGKTKLKPAGKASIDELVEALKTVGKRDFLVGGHTDNVPIKTRRYKSNWELSTQRAVVVTDYMIEQGFPPTQLGAAGYGEFDPIASNNSDDGKAQNRRIEIVLVPNLGTLKGLQKSLRSR